MQLFKVTCSYRGTTSHVRQKTEVNRMATAKKQMVVFLFTNAAVKKYKIIPYEILTNNYLLYQWSDKLQNLRFCNLDQYISQYDK